MAGICTMTVTTLGGLASEAPKLRGASRDPLSLVEEARVLADTVDQHRVRAEDGSLTWRGPRSPEPGMPYRMVRVDPHLYGGTVGIAVFLAAIAKVAQESRYRDLALEALVPLRRRLMEILDDPERSRTVKIRIGGCFGIGSLLYSFLKIASFLDEPELIREAHGLSALLTPERIAQDDLLDVVFGSAGAILALLALHRVAPEPNRHGLSPLAIAAGCARRLLSHRVSHEGAPRAWVTMPGHPPLTGFSHGAAGISYALLRLYAATGKNELWEAAIEGLAFERSLYFPEHKNWRDMRSPDLRFLVNWCHGAPGIALARIGGLDVADGPEVREEIRAGIEKTLSLHLTLLDHLCCGNFGRAEILLYAHQKLGDCNLLDASVALTQRARERAKANGYFTWLSGAQDPLFDPGFFTGAAGVGYALLRLAYPTTLPCLLVLE